MISIDKSTPAKKRVAIIYRNMAGFSGTPNTIMDHARYLAELGHEVTLVAEKLDRTRALAAGAGILRLRRWPLPKKSRINCFAWRADRCSRHFDFVAGHGHNLHQDVLSLHNCIHLAHEKVHGRPMATRDLHAALQDRIFQLQRFTYCIANSELMKRDLMRRYSIAAEKIVVIYPGYRRQRFNLSGKTQYRTAIRNEIGVGEATILFGLITSGDYQKRGVDIAIDAFAALSDAVRQRAMLVVIGKDSHLQQFQQQVAAYGLEERIRFMPATRLIERYYHGLDVYLHPARFEEFGQSVQEAMACGLPVIASRQVGAMELLSEAAYQSLPLALSVEALSRRLQEFIENADLRQQWQWYSQTAAERNSAEINFQKTLALYRQAGL